MDSYLSMRVQSGVVAQELVQAVAERMDVSPEDLVLVAVTYPGGKYHFIKLVLNHSFATVQPAVYNNEACVCCFLLENISRTITHISVLSMLKGSS